MSALRDAVALLTRVPVGASERSRGGAAAFALVGALVGIAGCVPLALIGQGEPMLAAVLAVGAMAVISGGLHLDGLADTADALVVPDRTRAEAARRDPSIGAAGAVAIGLVLAIDVAALAGLVGREGPGVAAAACIAAAAASRAVAVVATASLRGFATSDGFGAWFAARVGTVEVVLAVLTAIVIVAGLSMVAWPVTLAVGVGIGAGIGLGVAGGLVAARGQLDGDGLGATIELTVAAILSALVLLAAG